MPTVDLKLQEFRQQTFGVFDKLIYRQKPEILDLYPTSKEAANVIRDLDHFANASGLSMMLTKHLTNRIKGIQSTHTLKILEICAGSGWLSRSLKHHLHSKNIATKIITTDLKAPTASTQDTIDWQTADATKLPYKQKSFDLVVCAQALHHFDASMLTQVMQETERVGRSASLFDIRRTSYGIAMMALISPFYSTEFIQDGITSHRRAYSLKEMTFLIKEANLPFIARKFLPIGMLLEY